MNNINRGYLQSKYYANIIVLSKHGFPLATTSSKRAKWYINKNLAIEVDPPAPYERAIKLNFLHSGMDSPRPSELGVYEDKCVRCGCGDNLSLHHIIPHVIRKQFPLEHKKHSREWCVLLCLTCHDLVERITQPLYKKDFPKSPKTTTDITLQLLKSNKLLDRLPSAKIDILLSRSTYKSVVEIPEYKKISKEERNRKLSESHLKDIKKWALNFIEEHGGIEGVKQYFSEMFLSLNPQYLPHGYLDVLNTEEYDPKIS